MFNIIIMKKILIIITIILGTIILFGFSYDFYKDWSLKNEINNYPDYYKRLAENCKSKSGQSCCVSSVRNMLNGNFKLAPESECPKSFQKNMLKCVGSYKWCEPIK